MPKPGTWGWFLYSLFTVCPEMSLSGSGTPAVALGHLEQVQPRAGKYLVLLWNNRAALNHHRQQTTLLLQWISPLKSPFPSAPPAEALYVPQEKSQALLELFLFFEAEMLSTFSLRSATLWGQKDNEGSQGVGSPRCGKVISVLHLVLLELQTQSPSLGFVSFWDRHCCA